VHALPFAVELGVGAGGEGAEGCVEGGDVAAGGADSGDALADSPSPTA
jgi:hypothetical protein